MSRKTKVSEHVAMLREFAGDEVADDAIDEAHEDRISETIHLRAHLAEARAVLREIDRNSYNCPWPECTGEKGLKGHAPDCRLWAQIKEST